jgi:hypothetical protein
LNALIPSYADLSSPEIVAAQGGLVSVGSSYVTYIDKKGQVRDVLYTHVHVKHRKIIVLHMFIVLFILRFVQLKIK